MNGLKRACAAMIADNIPQQALIDEDLTAEELAEEMIEAAEDAFDDAVIQATDAWLERLSADDIVIVCAGEDVSDVGTGRVMASGDRRIKVPDDVDRVLREMFDAL